MQRTRSLAAGRSLDVAPFASRWSTSMRFAALLAATVFAGVVAQTATARADEPPDLIHDVSYSHPDTGVIAGGQGRLWHTDDGGRRWRLIEEKDAPSGGDMRVLNFLDQHEGWAAGGWTHPYTHRSSGVLLRTSDGGKTWRRLQGLTVPQFRDLRFFDRQQGWALVDPSPMYPNGVVWTRDGGRSWAGAPGELIGGARLAAFVSPEIAIVVGHGGEVVRMSPSDARIATLPREVGLQAMAADACGDDAWLVGDGGMILHSPDQGVRWRDCSLPPQLGRNYDLRVVYCDGQRCWTAGAPGTHIFVSDDAGAHWRRWATGQTLPIVKLSFYDAHRGWAALALGGLLATRDGGASWQSQLNGGQRAVLLAVQTAGTESSSSPWELPAHVCAEQGYYAAWESWEPRLAGHHDPLAGLRRQEAAVLMRSQPSQVMFPPPVLAALTEDHATVVEERLVRSIRQWRPEIVVVLSDAHHPFGSRWETLRNAAQRARDPSAYPDHLQAGLNVWQIKRVAVAGSADGSPVVISSGRLATPLGKTLSQFSRRARQLEQSNYSAGADQIELTVVWNQAGSPPRRDDLMTGVIMPPGSEGRRSVETAANLPDLHRRLQLRRNLDVLIGRATTSGEGQGVLLGQIDQLTRDLPADDAGEIVFQLAMSYAQFGQPEFAADLLGQLQERYPQHALNEAALLWRLQFALSEEHRWIRRASKNAVAQASAVREPTKATAPTVSQAFFVEPLSGVPQPAQPPSTPGVSINASQDQPQQLLQHIQQTRPELLTDPRVQLVMASHHRREGDPEKARQIWRTLARSGHVDWSRCGAWELDLVNGPISPRRTSYGCLRVDERPHLDGLLDDVLWSRAEVVLLNAQEGSRGQVDATQVMLVYDEEFLYLGVSSPLPPGANHEPLAKQRNRDAAVDSGDHFELLLDVDRDCSTFYRLAIDQVGRTFDACHLDQSWDPKWFVAVGHDSNRWTVEAAIAWSDLASQPPQQGEVWLMGLQRRVPKLGAVQAWTTPASSVWRSQNFGALRFD